MLASVMLGCGQILEQEIIEARRCGQEDVCVFTAPTDCICSIPVNARYLQEIQKSIDAHRCEATGRVCRVGGAATCVNGRCEAAQAPE